MNSGHRIRLSEGQVVLGILDDDDAAPAGGRQPAIVERDHKTATLSPAPIKISPSRALLLAASRLPRPYLEEAFARLTEENARLRQEVMAHSSLWQIAHQDPLTGLWNRRYADKRLAEEISRAKRETDYRYSIVLIDVDNMKCINDQMGHASGDQALRWVARFLKQGLRGHDLCCRVGGDEFLLVLPGSGERECRDLVDRIGRRWAAAAQAEVNAVSVSIGSASFPGQGDTVDALLSVADDAMYKNKRRHDPSRPQRTAPDAAEHRRDGRRWTPTV